MIRFNVNVISKLYLCVLILTYLSGLCYGQEKSDSNFTFIKVYKTQSCPVVPFPKIETEISDYKICFRNILPPRNKMYKEQLECYDTWNKVPKYLKIDSVDYDSVVNYISSSKLIYLDLNYFHPDTTGGLVSMISGGCSIKYIIETSNGIIELPFAGSFDFILPDTLNEFDKLFTRITNRYRDKIKMASH